MSKRHKVEFFCQTCGSLSGKWSGRCDSCGAWNSLVEQEQGGFSATDRTILTGQSFEMSTLSGQMVEAPRIPIGIAELDRVLGGGLVSGSVILVGGEPGIGKSTLLIQTAAAIAKSAGYTVYISGEEAVSQVQLRARRLGLDSAPIALGAETLVENILATLSTKQAPLLTIIDSIQTMSTGAVDSSPGTITQLRTSTQMLIRFAKQSGTAIILVGHVTKDGQIAGPRVIEHMVDAVLYFEGDAAHHFRILRAVKNRFGPTDEIGVFEMGNEGLSEVPNPSALFLGERDSMSSGIAVFAGMEGSRPLLVEIQALTAHSPFGTPRRAVVGWDSQRLAMILAVLEARCGLILSNQDIYLNVAGGLRIQEPAADLAAAAAIISSLTGHPLPSHRVYFGEIDLSGAIRKVARPDARLREAEKLGFTSATGPLTMADSRPDDRASRSHLSFTGIERLSTLITDIESRKS